MEKRLLLAFVLSALIFAGWSMLFPPPPPVSPAQETTTQAGGNGAGDDATRMARELETPPEDDRAEIVEISPVVHV